MLVTFQEDSSDDSPWRLGIIDQMGADDDSLLILVWDGPIIEKTIGNTPFIYPMFYDLTPDQLAKPMFDPIEPMNELIEPTNAPIEPTNAPIEPMTTPIKPTMPLTIALIEPTIATI